MPGVNRAIRIFLFFLEKIAFADYSFSLIHGSRTGLKKLKRQTTAAKKRHKEPVISLIELKTLSIKVYS